jgi:hypothetical protein
MSNQYYAIIQQRQMKSKHGGEVTEISLVGVKDRVLYRTYIDSFNRNYTFWAPIIHNPLRGYLLSGIKVKSSAKAVINADSAVQIVYQSDDNTELYSEIIAAWQKQDQHNKFGDLFS